MLVDSAVIHVRSGKGGAGCASFRRMKYVPKGGPDGGNGGDGGDVVLLAEAGLDTLLDFKGRHHWAAGDGRPGEGSDRDGHHGDDLIVRLPPGTLVFNDDTDELIVDLDQPGKRHVIATGGRGGKGNLAQKSATRQTPREAEPGQPATQRTLRLELKLIADVGLIGLPNAGKSTLLSRISAARPKVADYPFTTLEPQLGIAELDNARRLVVADIPGLIEKASQGVGLGNRFLRHIERTRLLVHLVEAAPPEAPDAPGTSPPADRYHAIRHELAQHSHTLAAKPELLVLSKIELLPPEEADQVANALEHAAGKPVHRISSATGAGLPELLQACWTAAAKGEHVPTGGWSATA
jgi:GTP-binding protein